MEQQNKMKRNEELTRCKSEIEDIIERFQKVCMRMEIYEQNYGFDNDQLVRDTLNPNKPLQENIDKVDEVMDVILSQMTINDIGPKLQTLHNLLNRSIRIMCKATRGKESLERLEEKEKIVSKIVDDELEKESVNDNKIN